MSITPINWWHCQKILPLVYDDSLSYYEMVCKLVNKVNEIIDSFKDYDEVIAELQEAITDIDTMKSDIATLQGKTSTLETELTNGLQNLSDAIASVNTYAKSLETRIEHNEESIASLVNIIAGFNANVDDKLNKLETKLTNLFNSFTADFTDELKMLQLKMNQIKVNLQGQIDVIKARLDEIDTSVINPWHSELGRINPDKNEKLVYSDLADAVPTAEEYLKLNLTADEYSTFGIQAMDYARRGKERLHYYWVFSPAYGWKQEISNVLTSIVNFIKDTITASVYTSYDLTADDYSLLDLTADEYYSYKQP